MYRISIVVVVVLLGIMVQRVLIAENGATADKPAAVKSDRKKIEVPPPAALQDRQDVKPPPAAAKADRGKADGDKTDRATAKQPPAKVDRQEGTGPAVKPPQQEGKPPAAKADREEKKPPVAAAAPKREAEKPATLEKPPAIKVERQEKTAPVATVTPTPDQHPAVKPQRESKRRHARPARRVGRAARRAYADVRQSAVRGNDAQVMRARKAWLRGLAHRYGFSDW